jgi:two-component system, response regulator PdtaR
MAPNKGRVLVVDDEPLVRFVAADALREAGYEVVEASNADDAMVMLNQDNFTTVLTDIEMPGAMNGLDLAWAVQGHNPRLPVVLVSGRQLPHQTEMPRTARFLAKPYRIETLLHLVAVSRD